MSIQDQIRQKFNEARKERNELNRKTYECVIAKIITAEKSGKYQLPLSDDIIVGLIQKEVKELEETRSNYLEIPPLTTGEEKVVEAVLKLDKQIAELKQYLPKALSEDEVMAIILNAINDGETNKGKLIKATVAAVGNQFEKSKIPLLVDLALKQGA